MQASCFPPAPATVKTIFRRHSVFGKEQLERGDAYAILEGFLVWKKRNALLGLPTKLMHLHPEQNGAKYNKQKRLSPILLGSLTAGFTMVSIELVLLSKQIPSIQAWWRALLSEDKKVNFLTYLSAKAFLPVCHSQGLPGSLCICRLAEGSVRPEQRYPERFWWGHTTSRATSAVRPGQTQPLANRSHSPPQSHLSAAWPCAAAGGSCRSPPIGCTHLSLHAGEEVTDFLYWPQHDKTLVNITVQLGLMATWFALLGDAAYRECCRQKRFLPALCTATRTRWWFLKSRDAFLHDRID